MDCHRMPFITLTSFITSCLIASVLMTDTYETTEHDGTKFYCNYCLKGTYWTGNCVAPNPISTCLTCPKGRFQNVSNKAQSCEPCLEDCPDHQENKDPPSRMVVVTNCTAMSNLKCQCDAGYYWSPANLCSLQDACEAGSGVVTPGTPQKDTKCEECLDGQTFSENSSLTEKCQPCSRCPEGLLEKLPCTRTNGTVCEEKHDGDGLSTGGIIGIVAGVLFITIFIIICVCNRCGYLAMFCKRCDPIKEPCEKPYTDVNYTNDTPNNHDGNCREYQVDHANATPIDNTNDKGVRVSDGILVKLSEDVVSSNWQFFIRYLFRCVEVIRSNAAYVL